MRSSSLALGLALAAVAALAMTLPSCAHPQLSSPDGLALGGPHPLLQHRAPTISVGPENIGARLDAKYDGKVVIVHFWATWAEASRATLPKLEVLYAKYKHRGVEIVALSVDDDRDSIDELVASTGVHFPVVWDARKDVVRQWLVKGVPASFVVDRRGVVRAAFLGYEDGVEVEIETDVKLLTADPPSGSGGLARK